MQVQQTEVDAPRVTDGPLPRSSRLLIAVLVVSAFVMILNETIMSVALPTLMVDLAIDAAQARFERRPLPARARVGLGLDRHRQAPIAAEAASFCAARAGFVK